MDFVLLQNKENKNRLMHLIKIYYGYVENLLYSRYNYFTSLISGEELVQEGDDPCRTLDVCLQS